MNLRWEFREYFARAHEPTFLRQPDGIVRPLQTQYFLWAGMPEGGATMMLGRAIQGLEAYICAAALFEGTIRGQSSAKLRAASANPFSLGGGAADNYFNGLPALVARDLAMRKAEPALWSRTVAFYREIRNPISHGDQFSEITHDQFASLFDHLAAVYEWVDGWHDPNHMGSGAAESFAVKRRSAAT